MAVPYTLIDAYAMHAAHEGTFDNPSPARLAALKVGDFVKIGVQFDQAQKVGEEPFMRRLWAKKVGEEVADNTQAERFWLQVTWIDGRFISGNVNNDLVYTAHHGLRCGDSLQVERRHILDVLKARP